MFTAHSRVDNILGMVNISLNTSASQYTLFENAIVLLTSASQYTLSENAIVPLTSASQYTLFENSIVTLTSASWDLCVQQIHISKML